MHSSITTLVHTRTKTNAKLCLELSYRAKAQQTWKHMCQLATVVWLCLRRSWGSQKLRTMLSQKKSGSWRGCKSSKAKPWRHFLVNMITLPRLIQFSKTYAFRKNTTESWKQRSMMLRNQAGCRMRTWSILSIRSENWSDQPMIPSRKMLGVNRMRNWTKQLTKLMNLLKLTNTWLQQRNKPSNSQANKDSNSPGKLQLYSTEPNSWHKCSNKTTL